MTDRLEKAIAKYTSFHDKGCNEPYEAWFFPFGYLVHDLVEDVYEIHVDTWDKHLIKNEDSIAQLIETIGEALEEFEGACNE